MKIYRFPAAIALFAALTVLPALGQTKPAPAGASQTAAVPDGKIALVFSDDFQDSKTGIARIAAVMNTLAREFQPRQTDLNQMAQKIQQLQDEIPKLQATANPDQRLLQAKIDQLDQLKTDYKRKGEDAQAAYKKRNEEAFAPIREDIARALEAYAKAHGISVLIDGSAVPLAYWADTIDITRAFINDYNSKNPATAALTQPK